MNGNPKGKKKPIQDAWKTLKSKIIKAKSNTIPQRKTREPRQNQQKQNSEGQKRLKNGNGHITRTEQQQIICKNGFGKDKAQTPKKGSFFNMRGARRK